MALRIESYAHKFPLNRSVVSGTSLLCRYALLMTLTRNIFLLLHTIGFIGILGALLSQIPKAQKRILSGAMHSALLSLVAGLALVGVHASLHASDPTNWDELNNGKIGIKFIFLVIILVLGFKNYKKPFVSTTIWATMVGLTLANLVIAMTL